MSRNPAQLPPPLVLFQMLSGFMVSQALYVAARLGLADELANGPRTVEDLAAATETHAETLYRLLRALASVDLFAEDEHGRFGLTPLAAAMKSGPGSVRAMILHLGESPTWLAWGDLLNSIKTGATAFQSVHGQEVFPYYAGHPESSRPFNEAMTEYSQTVAAAVLKAYDFSRFAHIVDVGGGHGSLLTSILQNAPEASGVVFDLPAVIAGTRDQIEAAKLTGRCEAMGGNFFESVPAGGDAYVLKAIIHDWDDARAAGILRNIRRGIQPGGKLLLIETVVPPGNEPSFSKFGDLHMLVMTGGRERTQEQFATLCETAGFRLTRVVPTESMVSLVEAEPVA